MRLSRVNTELRCLVEDLIVQTARQNFGPGLLDGKMGAIITLFVCGRVLQRRAITILAEKMLNNMLANLSKGSSICFASGLSGIVWGIDFLIEHSYIQGNPGYICSELTNATMSLAPSRLDLSLGYGIRGLLHHILAHLKQSSSVPFENSFLQDVYNHVIWISKTTKEEDLLVLCNAFIRFYEEGRLEYTCSMQYLLSSMDETSMLCNPEDLSIQTGISGKILKFFNHIYEGDCISIRCKDLIHNRSM